MSDAPKLRLGTRASPLARWQADWVRDQLIAAGIDVEMILITTEGDQQTSQPLGQIGGQGLFTKEIQRRLLAGDIDLAVHSLKDLPTLPIDGLSLAAVPEREDTADILIGPAGTSLATLPSGAKIGTGSLRRKAQLLHARADLEILDIRGNVDTRLRKLDEGQYHAIILAAAGLKRLKLDDRMTERLEAPLMLPAVGQGALGIESRTDDPTTRKLLAPLSHAPTLQAVIAERSLLAALRAGCLAPVGAHAQVVDGQLTLAAVVLSIDGQSRLFASLTSAPADAAQLGEEVAELLRQQGATELLASSRGNRLD